MKRTLHAAACTAVFLAASTCLAPVLADSPRDFLKDAIKGDNSEIMLGRMSERRAATPAARDFAHRLIADHSLAKSEAMHLAARLHMRSPAGPDRNAME